jgi:hypothetical protein
VGLQFDDFPFATKNEEYPQPPAAAFGFCVGVKNGARSSLINCMMIPTVLDFSVGDKRVALIQFVFLFCSWTPGNMPRDSVTNI